MFDDYDYEIRTLSDLNIFESSEFYKNDILIRRIEDESCMTYYYNKGQLIETKWGRICPGFVRNLLIHDLEGNYIADYITRDSVVNLDTIKYEQTKFYNIHNQIIRELIHEFNAEDGERIRYWREYTYKQNKVDKEFTYINKVLNWKGQYYYDSRGNLIRIERFRNGLYEKEFFTYNNKNKLIKEEIKSTDNPITSDVTHSAGNNYKTYKYDSKGFLIEKDFFNHKNEIYHIEKYQRIPLRIK
ncbi:MAG: hypothetical protein IPP61_15970 [Cytophagaceae bacterium]|nr:hypothetical protein [Cytophagaceae bacterium]MBK9936274.1 hypothetical protein [Cytophagaceae bacterium]MBL0303832.1 hypothetical protein [Cytophagaceae bacterium]MBL0326648.1 hypothetical protein [Cytophagaceae bacterium]